MNHATTVERLGLGQGLTRDETSDLFDDILAGRVPPDILAAILRALADKGETVDEIVGAATALRRRALPVRLPAGARAIDTCGTGGDGQPFFNISTATAIVAAASGATVAKHGNRSNLRPSGSAEVLAALGVNVDADVPVLERCLAEAGIAFLYAARLHPAMAIAAPVRQALGRRTIFNLVGPLANPAGVRRQLLGVNRADLVEPMLAALRELGAERAAVVHGLDGVCDVSLAALTRVGWWDGRVARVSEITPEDVGLSRASMSVLEIRSPTDSAGRIHAVLGGERGPARDIVVLNAAVAAWVAGLVDDWRDGRSPAEATLDEGAASATLARWIQVSHDRSGRV